MSAPASLHFAVLAVDVVLVTYRDGDLFVLTIPVHLPPYFSHAHGLPGGLIRPEETAERAVERILLDKTGVALTKGVWIDQLAAFSEVDRDPRGRVVSLAYVAVLPPELHERTTLAHGATWMKVSSRQKLAYDHDLILATAIKRIQGKLVYMPIASWLLPKKFTLTDVQGCYERLLHRSFDRRNFRKRLQRLEILEEVGEFARGQHRPAMLYRFAKKLPEIVSMIAE